MMVPWVGLEMNGVEGHGPIEVVVEDVVLTELEVVEELVVELEVVEMEVVVEVEVVVTVVVGPAATTLSVTGTMTVVLGALLLMARLPP